MAIQTSELIFYRSLSVTDGEMNGGRMGTLQVVDSVKNNILPDPTQEERTAGVTRYRKLFVKNENTDNLALYNTGLHLSQRTSAEDRVVLLEGTQRDTQSALAASRAYGCGVLKTDVSAGESSFTLVLEDSQDLIQSGDAVWIGDGSNEEYFSSVTVERTDNEATVTLRTGDQLANDYAAASTSGAAVLACGSLTPLSSGWTETSSAGAYDENSAPLELDNLGAVEDDWTLVFTDVNSFSMSGVYAGELASGVIGSDFAPSNPAVGRPYFTLRMAGWGGSWQSGDTITFSTHPAAAPFWVKQVVPAGAAADGAVTFALQVTGESA